MLDNFRRTGEISLYGELYKRYIPLVYGLCLKYLANTDAAHDAVMDIFENVMEKLPNYEVQNFKAWLYTVAKNHCFQVIRKEKKVFFMKIEETVVENEEIYTLIDRPQTKEEMEALSNCIEKLPEVQQKSINYFYIEDKSYADIVELTGYTLKSVKSYIQNGKRNLKICMEKTLHLN